MSKKLTVAARIYDFLQANQGQWFSASRIAKEIGSTVSSVEANLYHENLRTKTRHELRIAKRNFDTGTVVYKNVFTCGGAQESDEVVDVAKVST